jgi:hypothetical protein
VTCFICVAREKTLFRRRAGTARSTRATGSCRRTRGRRGRARRPASCSLGRLLSRWRPLGTSWPPASTPWPPVCPSCRAVVLALWATGPLYRGLWATRPVWRSARGRPGRLRRVPTRLVGLAWQVALPSRTWRGWRGGLGFRFWLRRPGAVGGGAVGGGAASCGGPVRRNAWCLHAERQANTRYRTPIWLTLVTSVNGFFLLAGVAAGSCAGLDCSMRTGSTSPAARRRQPAGTRPVREHASGRSRRGRNKNVACLYTGVQRAHNHAPARPDPGGRSWRSSRWLASNHSPPLDGSTAAAVVAANELPRSPHRPPWRWRCQCQRSRSLPRLAPRRLGPPGQPPPLRHRARPAPG